MQRLRAGCATLAITLIGICFLPESAAANCTNTGSFDAWMKGFRREALAKGITARTVSAALDGITLDQGIIARDRKQTFFTQSFIDFVGKLATENRRNSSLNQIAKHRAVFDRAEKEFGVPAPVLTAFWALESDFGAGMGKLSVLRSLATLAYDCRRGEFFREELLEALRIIDKGDLEPADMIGSWAGELGQTQFLPSHYNAHAIDYDGDGRRDLFRSIPDIIGSSAKFVVHLGWRRGEPWLEEVRVPERLPWDQADLTILHPRSKWAEWGVTRPNGSPLPNDAMPASLLLMMGRNGPAFLAYQNFRVYTEWNKSLNYATTAAYLATRIAGAPPMIRGRGPVEVLDDKEVRELQRLLARKGYDVGEIDGLLGAATRAAVKQAQMKYNLPADSYPTMELIERLR
ncbi:MAG TPA: lytic murein transglycosylase [Hyphomicrobiaceae bacterium]|nr:lytic murein transglycosylase [Hyphomicrobiaceae bacterium]